MIQIYKSPFVLRTTLTLGLLALFFISLAQSVNIYVSPTGASTGNGSSIVAPVNLAQARIVVKANANVPCTVWLMDGNYGTSRILLDATDSRTANAPVSYKAINPLKVFI